MDLGFCLNISGPSFLCSTRAAAPPGLRPGLFRVKASASVRREPGKSSAPDAGFGFVGNVRFEQHMLQPKKLRTPCSAGRLVQKSRRRIPDRLFAGPKGIVPPAKQYFQNFSSQKTTPFNKKRVLYNGFLPIFAAVRGYCVEVCDIFLITMRARASPSGNL